MWVKDAVLEGMIGVGVAVGVNVRGSAVIEGWCVGEGLGLGVLVIACPAERSLTGSDASVSSGGGSAGCIASVDPYAAHPVRKMSMQPRHIACCKDL